MLRNGDGIPPYYEDVLWIIALLGGLEAESGVQAVVVSLMPVWRVVVVG
jgi:hypothetical protein